MIKNTNKNEANFQNMKEYPSNYILINLNNLSLNYHHIKDLLASDTCITAMVKSNAYGHGMITISLHLQKLGVESFGVFTLEEGIELTDKHFEVIEYLRNETANGSPLTIRKVGKSGITDIKGLYDLFPGGPLKKSSRIAGIPKPSSCV